MKKSLILVLSICMVFLIIGLLPVHGEAEIYDSVLRLHILANSDSDEDQALKLKVRDAILAEGGELFRDCRDLQEATDAVEKNRGKLLEIARRTIADEGYDYPVELKLSEEEYPIRTYGAVCFPSGRYLSLQILIGEAEGKNWWCVLFPPLCLSAATETKENEDAFISVGLSTDQYRVITETQEPPYKVRFKILEVIEAATS